MSYQSKLIGVLAICLLPYMILFAYCHPSGDDFSYAVLGTKQPFLSALLDEYNLWNGRYTSNIFVLKNPLIVHHSWIWFYRSTLLAIFVFSACSLYFFFYYFLRTFLNPIWILVVTLLFLLLNLYQMPILSEGTYWYTGVVTYQLANSLFLFYLIGLHNFSNLKNQSVKLLFFSVLFISCILLAGFNEVMMLVLVVLHVTILMIQLQNKLRNSEWFIGLLIAAIISFCCVYFAPGNKVREAYFIGESHRFWHSLVHTFLQIIRFVVEWFSNGVLILLSLVFLAIHSSIEKHIFALINFLHLNRWITLCSLIGVLFLSIFPAYWSTGIMGQHRTVNSAYFYFIFLWFLNLSLWSKSSFVEKIKVGHSLKRNAFIISLFLLGLTNNSFFAWKNLLSDDAKKYNQELNERYRLLNKFPKNSDQLCELPCLKTKPVSIFIYDISNDPKYFPNTCYKTYWNLNSYIIAK